MLRQRLSTAGAASFSEHGSSLLVPGLGNTTCRGALLGGGVCAPPSRVVAADPAERFVQEGGYVTQAEPSTDTLPNLDPVAKPKNASCSRKLSPRRALPGCGGTNGDRLCMRALCSVGNALTRAPGPSR